MKNLRILEILFIISTFLLIIDLFYLPFYEDKPTSTQLMEDNHDDARATGF